MSTEKFAFRMFLNPGCVAEYKKRHDAIWPELVELLKTAGVSKPLGGSFMPFPDQS